MTLFRVDGLTKNEIAEALDGLCQDAMIAVASESVWLFGINIGGTNVCSVEVADETDAVAVRLALGEHIREWRGTFYGIAPNSGTPLVLAKRASVVRSEAGMSRAALMPRLNRKVRREIARFCSRSLKPVDFQLDRITVDEDGVRVTGTLVILPREIKRDAFIKKFGGQIPPPLDP